MGQRRNNRNCCVIPRRFSKHGFKDQKLVSCGGGTNREERKREKKKKRKKKKKKRRRGREDQEVWNFGFLVWKLLWVWILYGSHGILRFCMISILSLNLGF